LSTQLIDQSFTCSVCRNSFKAQVVESVSHQGQDSDFYPHYIGVDPLPHFLVMCPGCSYCGYPDDFFAELDKPPIKAEKIKDILEQPVVKKFPAYALKYYLAGKIYEEQKRNPYHIGNLYLRGSWCCRKEENRKAEIEFQQLAVKFLRTSVDHSTFINPENLPVITYLVGELYRRLEDKVSAREWLGTVEEVIFDSEQQWLLELAKKQAELNEYFIN